MTLSGLRSGLKTRLQTIAGLNVYDYPPDQVFVPCALIGLPPGEVQREIAMGASSHAQRLVVQVYVSEATGAVDAQTALDPYLDESGTKSLEAAIYGDRSLGGACSSVVVMDKRNNGIYEYGNVNYLGAELLLEAVGA